MSRVKVSQCGNFRNFLSLRFYVKSMLKNLEVIKLPFCHFWALKFVNLVNLSLQKVQKFIKSKLRASRCVRMADFALLQIDFT